jgi:sulfate transport system permease protein
MARLGLRFAALGYLAMLLVLPIGLVFWRTFEHGLGPVVDAATTPEALHALWLTVLIAAIAVPANTIFGVVCALVIVRGRFQGKTLLNAFIDLPFALSPVVVGLALFLVYARTGWVGGWLVGNGIQVIFALPGMVLATIFVSLPFVVREVVPVLREIGTEQEEAAWTLGASPLAAFWRVTLPAIRWGITYGVVLTTARAIGEFGADRLGQHRRADADAHPARAGPLPGFRPHRGLHGLGGAGAPRAGDAPRHDAAQEGGSAWR